MENLLIGSNRVISNFQEVTGQFVEIGGEKFYQIKHFDNMPPFFISLASDSNHWMYVSSNGGLTAGRKNPDHALFPYYTDDKIHDSAETTGSKTIFQVLKNGNRYLWEPFSVRNIGIYSIERNISKSTIGNKIIFEEKNHDLGLVFCYGWMNADDFGWVKKSWIINENDYEIEISMVDGLQNILPYGVNQLTQNRFSTLVDAYKKSELIEEANLGLFRMESIMVDRAEPSEALRVTTVWNYGLENVTFLLSSSQLDQFRRGQPLIPEFESKGVRGAFFACSDLILKSKENKTWYIVAELNQDATQVNNLIKFIKSTKDLGELIEDNILKGTESLRSIVGMADGIQSTANEHTVARHFSNVLFNTMRGGIYVDGYNINIDNFNKHLKHFNIKIQHNYEGFISELPCKLSCFELEKLILEQNDPSLYRLFLEYLPLTFSRRHGDPSRPWNLFNINVKDDKGNKLISYQGNWRDIFQNWEALSYSYPGFINGIIAKFLNASTADGYNPYKVTSEGFEWEVIEPDNPWSNIGYWGDHQIIYLLKLLEISRSHYPDILNSWLNKEIFAYANVPYRFKNYEDIVSNPKNSIYFDDQLHCFIEKLVPEYGKDAKLILNSNGDVKLVTFTEKILVTILTKLSNFIPEAGIWMNTLRPEWNDANNALVGYGASMVTLYHLRRFVGFMREIYQCSTIENFTLSEEVADFFEHINRSYKYYAFLLEKGFDDQHRKNLTDKLGVSCGYYRKNLYKGFTGNKKTVHQTELIKFFDLILAYIDQSISVNRRQDNMYHSYNLISFSTDSIKIRHLYEMLEGQVAILSSGKLSATETLDLLDSLRKSKLYRPDQDSFMLYPDKRLPMFNEKNIIPEEDLNNINLLKLMVDNADTSIVSKDKMGFFHFNADFSNSGFLTEVLIKLRSNSVYELTDQDQQAILDLYERIFDHQSFTGRSGSFYKYEGLGSIYWHMVSKLLLATGESIKRIVNEQEEPQILNSLINHYYAIQYGIGAHKSPKLYGSFPFDPYSHTPANAGVQQPGMTGQVKEDIINRFFELGLIIQYGQLLIKPFILKRKEFIIPDLSTKNEYSFPYLSFTYCSIPFVYLVDGREGIDYTDQSDRIIHINGYAFSVIESKWIFNHENKMKRVIVHLVDVG